MHTKECFRISPSTVGRRKKEKEEGKEGKKRERREGGGEREC